MTMVSKLAWSRFAIIGHSMGGKMGLLLALIAAVHVDRFVGLSPVWRGGRRSTTRVEHCSARRLIP